MITNYFRAILIAMICAAATPNTASARTVYDGTWSVLIITDRGTCDRAYRYGVQIQDGNVVYRGGGPINLNGRVAPNGAVRVTVISGNQRADGQGRLSRDAGGGTWRGQGSSSSCAGTWEAERRG